MTSISDFYFDRGANQTGDTFQEILQWDDERLERGHTYIQWLFPLDEPSNAVPGSPYLSSVEIEELRGQPVFHLRFLGQALPLMLRFYGLYVSADTTIVKGDNWEERRPHWADCPNHNHLRLTRIMKSLALLGHAAYAKALQDCLLQIVLEYPFAFSPKTIHFWKDTV